MTAAAYEYRKRLCNRKERKGRNVGAVFKPARLICVFCNAVVENLRSLRKFPRSRKLSDSDIPPAKHVLSPVEGAPRR